MMSTSTMAKFTRYDLTHVFSSVVFDSLLCSCVMHSVTGFCSTRTRAAR